MDTLRRKNEILSVLTLGFLVFTATYSTFFIVVPAGSTLLYETVKFVSLSISAFGVLFSALLSSFNSLEASMNNQDKVKFDRTENSLKYMERWDAPTLKEARDLLRELAQIKSRLSDDGLVDRIVGRDSETPNEKNPLTTSVITMFNFFEEIELSLQASRCDDDFIKRYFKDIYTKIYDVLLPWLNSDRHKHIGPDMKTSLQGLRKRWG